MKPEKIIEVKNLKVRLGNEDILKNVNFSVDRGEIFAIVGRSGSGKTTLLRALLGLTPPTLGTIKIFEYELTTASPEILLAIQRRWGVLFQQSALFSSYTLLENVSFPLQEHTDLDEESIKELAQLKILMTGLPIDAANKYPAELSGGMQRRSALSRAIVLDPEILFLDEPTSGLDPDTATGFDDLILNLQSTMGLTIVMVTHDLDSLWKIADRVAFIGDGSIIGVDTIQNIVKNPHVLIQEFFAGPRGRIAQKAYTK